MAQPPRLSSFERAIPVAASLAGSRITAVRRLLTLCCAIVLVDTIFYAALTPLVPYFNDEFGLSKSAVGLLGGAFGAGVLAGAAPGGYLASRAGVKAAALVGLALMSVTSMAFAVADTTWLLLLTRFVGGFGSALSWVAAFTWLVARAPEGRRGELIGVMLSAAVVGALLGPVLGSAAAIVGLVPAFTGVALAGLAIALWAVFEPAPAPTGDGSPVGALGVLRRPRLLTGLLFVAFSPLLFSALTVLVPLDLSAVGWGAAAVGAVFLVSAGFEALVHPLFGRWTDRSGYRPPVLAALLASIAILAALAYSANPWLLALLVVLAGVAFNAPLVPGTALFSRGTEKAGLDQAVAFAITNFAWASGYAVGAPLGGFLADLGGDALSYVFLIGVCLAAMLLLRAE
ncbi:MFS transporter [Rubrobacter tropicus]|uniref:MFS transporter n=1 Tax=Rubrobacter tropicus TaxID=2653851 RepID=A0A6G8QBC1_9ACTN|nr:MFS transporter [Rubrobacter tropicus]